MPTIPIIKASQAHPFIDFLNRSGCATHTLLKKAALPGKLIEPCEGYIAERQLWKLLNIVAHDEGLEQFGLEVGLKVRVEDLGVLALSLQSQPTLYALLTRFCQLARQESSHANFWLEFHRRGWYFCRGGIPEITVGKHHAELYTLMIMIKIIQIKAGNHWQPANIRLQSTADNVIHHYPLLTRANVRFSQAYTAIEVPFFSDQKSFTDLALTRAPCPPPTKAGENTPADTAKLNFADTLRLLIPFYVSSGNPGIDTMAEVTGLSARTVQRKLARTGLKYNELVQQVRFEMALE